MLDLGACWRLALGPMASLERTSFMLDGPLDGPPVAVYLSLAMWQLWDSVCVYLQVTFLFLQVTLNDYYKIPSLFRCWQRI